MNDATCPLCRSGGIDAEMHREQVWEDRLWRLTTSVSPAPAAGFSYLEPKRHITDLTQLDGEEAATFGSVLTRCAATLKQATGAELVYVYIFGDSIPHLHVHLAPHVRGDVYCDTFIKGDVEERTLPSGAVEMISKGYPTLSEKQIRGVAFEVRRLLSMPG